MRRGGVKSFVDDLVLGRGVVSSRAATSLRTVETQPWTRRFVRTPDEQHLRVPVRAAEPNHPTNTFTKLSVQKKRRRHQTRWCRRRRRRLSPRRRRPRLSHRRRRPRWRRRPRCCRPRWRRPCPRRPVSSFSNRPRRFDSCPEQTNKQHGQRFGMGKMRSVTHGLCWLIGRDFLTII